MRFIKASVVTGAGLGLAVMLGSVQAQAQALAGKVTSAQEPIMEGVIVSAKKEGSTRTISVVTNDKGEYAFPSGRLDAGKYTLSIRAAGYDLQDPASVDVGTSGSKADLTLVKAKNEALQLSTAEWLMSAPGLSDKQK